MLFLSPLKQIMEPVKMHSSQFVIQLSPNASSFSCHAIPTTELGTNLDGGPQAATDSAGGQTLQAGSRRCH
jgi:hypothetical protein